MDTAAFDLEAVVAKLKEGKLANAQELEKFVNETEGVNNVDLDKDGAVDELTVKEEKSGDGKTAMAIVAHPKTGEESVVAEVKFERAANGNVEVSGAYPEYVQGYQDHYYRHTLTGSTLGDMMFYSWLFSPRPVYVPSYRYGMYYGSPRHVMNTGRLSSTRTTYRTTTKMSPIRKQVRPSTYKPSTTFAQKSASRFKSSPASARGSTLSSKKGASQSFTKRSGTKSKATGFGASKSSSGSRKSGWGSSSSSRKSGWGSSSSRRSSFGSSRRR